MKNKAIVKQEVIKKEGKSGNEYFVLQITLSNGKTHDIFINRETAPIIDTVGVTNVKVEFVEKVSKDNKPYSAFELSIPQAEYTELIFPTRQLLALITLLNK